MSTAMISPSRLKVTLRTATSSVALAVRVKVPLAGKKLPLDAS